ncbi:glycosyltransferase family 61 protein [Methylobacterium sp. J-078]|uniref:glycosyltransferase family 61 protein n=1 Tax=Methylobacterium sp. J-078 TaxID=2836657 RepID=UPI001FB9626F|nr:glycosyltransferase 61 family protein [Methylobacterium sp. J-078]MCJ2044846.1 glycosyltransferase family 61 protein [Methylobacterium sp. J-078]
MRDLSNFDFVDVSKFPSATLSEVMNLNARSIWIQQGSENRQFLRRRPDIHDDPDKVKLFGDLSTRIVDYPPIALISESEVKLVGFRTFLTKDNRFFNDQIFTNNDELTRYLSKLSHEDEFQNEKTKLRRINETGFEFQQGQRQEVFIDEKVIVICSDEPNNYGSFLFRVLPKLALRLLVVSDYKILVPGVSSSIKEILSKAGIEQERIISHNPEIVYHLNHALIPTLRNPQAYLDESSLGLYRSISGFDNGRKDPSRVFVSREGLASTRSGYRRMVNAEEVIHAVEQLKFKIIRPEEISISEQISIFSSSQIVVGQSGAGMFNVVFCRPGTIIVDIESEPNWIHAHMCLFSSLNLRYVVFEGVADRSCGREIHFPFRVNTSALVHRLSSLLAET